VNEQFGVWASNYPGSPGSANWLHPDPNGVEVDVDRRPEDSDHDINFLEEYTYSIPLSTPPTLVPFSGTWDTPVDVTIQRYYVGSTEVGEGVCVSRQTLQIYQGSARQIGRQSPPPN
jgi:hypothetical protein